VSNRRLVIALACLAAPGLALAAKWEKVGESGPVQVWVDKESIRKSGTEARANLEWRWSRPTDVPDADPPRQYRLERQVQISNCSNRAYAVSEGTRYADDRGLDPVSSYKYDELSLPYSVAPARSVRDLVVTYTCTAPAAAPPAKK
jgi:hypothetical protein